MRIRKKVRLKSGSYVLIVDCTSPPSCNSPEHLTVASRLVPAMSAWSGKKIPTCSAPGMLGMRGRVYGHETAAMHHIDYTRPPATHTATSCECTSNCRQGSPARLMRILALISRRFLRPRRCSCVLKLNYYTRKFRLLVSCFDWMPGRRCRVLYRQREAEDPPARVDSERSDRPLVHLRQDLVRHEGQVRKRGEAMRSNA